jgi:predicted HD superfamily hydrolase involved in NAD metabolism
VQEQEVAVAERTVPVPDVAARLREAVDALPRGLREHVYRVVREARRLAALYGVDQGRIELAALGHDLARAMSSQELLDAAEAFGLDPSEVERSEPILLHGPVSARLMACHYGIDDPEVLAAARYHTTARPGMGLLEKMLFLADKIDQGKVRERPALAEVRRLARRDPDEAILKYLDLNLARAVEKGWPLHPDSLAARDELLLRRRPKP